MKKLFFPLSFSSSALKFIACVTMVIDHVGFLFFPDQLLWRIIGRLAFPLFAFLIAEGYCHTKNVKKYGERLIIFAFISELPFVLLMHAGGVETFDLNIFFTLAAGLLALVIVSRLRFLYAVPLVALICIVAQFLRFDYGAYGVLTILASYLFLKKRKPGSLALILLPFLKSPISILQFTAIFSVPFVALYNGERGFPLPRRLLYWFYPTHIMLIWTIWYFFI